MHPLEQHQHLLYATRRLDMDTTEVSKYFTGRALFIHKGDSPPPKPASGEGLTFTVWQRTLPMTDDEKVRQYDAELEAVRKRTGFCLIIHANDKYCYFFDGKWQNRMPFETLYWNKQ